MTSKYTVQRVGNCRQPVVIIDDFHSEMGRLREAAAEETFVKLGPYYPGLQAPADPRHLQPVGAILTDIFKQVFGVETGVKLVQCSYSMVTTQPEALAPIQRLPHVDTTDPGRIALLHYLSGEDTGGTAFYRHRATGTEVLNDADFATYKHALEAEGEPKSGYMCGSDGRFEMIGHVAAKPNRAVLYRSQLLHSGMIPEDLPFSQNPAQARLTLNSFFQTRDKS